MFLALNFVCSEIRSAGRLPCLNETLLVLRETSGIVFYVVHILRNEARKYRPIYHTFRDRTFFRLRDIWNSARLSGS
jgi:hypothetical protein